MSVAITVRDLSKRYRIGVSDERSDSFVGQIANAIKTPIRNLRNLRNLSSFKGEDDPSVYWALKDINFDVLAGEVLGIIGHNGAGKSTLLKILSRITEPTTGEITIKGRVSSLLEVGTGFHPDLTGRENVYMNGTILGMRKREINAKFEEIVEFSGIGKYIDTPVKRYSSGMKVRLAFSVAAYLEPEVLIIDEVLAVGDAEFQAKCLGKMENVAMNGRTVLFVSHQMGAVSKLTSRCMWLSGGTVKLTGYTPDVVQRYLADNSKKTGAIVKSKYFNELNVFVKNENGENSKSLNYTSFFSVEFSGQTNQELKDVAFFYRIENNRGEIVSTYNSLDADTWFNFSVLEDFSIRHEMGRNVLVPGKYYITFATQDRSGGVLEALSQVAGFEVNTIGVPKRFFSYKASQGMFYIKGDWRRHE